MSNSLIIPCLRYRDAAAAIDWLCSAFGFEKQVAYPNPDGSIAHAQLTLDGGMVMLGSVGKVPTEWGKLIRQPDELGGVETQSAYVCVHDADTVYARAKAAGAAIVIDIKDEDYGGRGFSCRDPEGHLWSIERLQPLVSGRRFPCSRRAANLRYKRRRQTRKTGSALRVHIYTDIDTLFGRAARLWMDVLLQAGHEAEFIDLGTSTDAPLPEVGPSDVNLLIAGIYALPRFARHGLPRHGKHVLWMFDPLTRDASATVHSYKAGLFDAIAPGLHAVMAMDAGIARYLAQHFPALSTFHLPYLVADKHVREPLAEALRSRDIVMLGGDTRRAGARPSACSSRMTQASRAESRVHLGRPLGRGARCLPRRRRASTSTSMPMPNCTTSTSSAPLRPGRPARPWCPTALKAGRISASSPACTWPWPNCKTCRGPARSCWPTCRGARPWCAPSQALLRERFSPAAWQGRMLAMMESIA